MKDFVLPEEVGNFQGFRVFDHGVYTKIENSEIFATLVNSEECVLIEEVGNFRGFRVFDFGPYTEFENSKTRKFNVKWICFIWGS